jgi:5-methylcytosine-specific restriction protein A
MPIKKICNHIGCNTLIDIGQRYCGKHADIKREYNPNRESFRQRGYDTRYDKVSATHKREHPLCEECLKHNHVSPVEITHHPIPTQLCRAIGREDLITDKDNMTARCRPCHGKEEGNDKLWYEFAKVDKIHGTAKEIIERFERWKMRYGKGIHI